MSAASQDRDWSILPKDEPDDQDDQATNLPLSFNLDITSVHYFLKNPGDFDIWLRNITWYLKTLGLDKLLDIKVPRPRRESPESSRWLDFSRKVSKWLAHNISDDLLKKILAHGKRTELADELIAEAKAEFETAAIYADISCVQKFMWIIPDTYATTKEFVLQFMEMLLDIWATQPVRIHPYFALCQLLVKLHIFDNKSIFAPIIADLNKKADDYHLQSDFSIVDFQDTCHNIVERLETAQAVLRLQNRKYWPPPGANHHEHAKMLRETLPQYTEDKKCAYCGGLFHLASKCYWLNPDARPPNWQPKGGIWMYEPEKFDAQTLDSPTPAAQTLGGSTGDSSSVDDSSSSGLTLGGITIGSPSVGRPVVGDKTAVKQRQLSINEEEKAPAADENRQDAPKFGSIEARIFGKRSTEPTGPAEPLIKLSDNGKVKPWVIVDEDAPHACGDKSVMTDYQEYDRDDKPVCKVLQRIPEMAKTRASGWGKVKIEVLLTDGTSDEITVDCRYYEGLRLNIFFMGQAQRDLAITFDAKDSTLRDGEGNQVACAVKVDGRNYLRTPTFNEMVQ